MLRIPLPALAGLLLAISGAPASAQLGATPPAPLPAPALSTPAPAVVAQDVPILENGHAVGIYQELSCYSASVQRSYEPGYTPHPSTLFENPRSYPSATCVLATPYYMYANIPGWFFASPSGYQSSVPPGSHVLAYEQGNLGITENMKRGYPEGKKVIQTVLKPVAPVCEKAGIFISARGGPLGLYAAPPADCGLPGVPQPAMAPPQQAMSAPPVVAPAPAYVSEVVEK